MRNRIILISGIFILLSFILTNCTKENFLPQQENEMMRKSKDINELIVKARKIAYDNFVPEEIFKEFEKSLIFDEKIRLTGAIYDGIEKYFDDKQSDAFWGVFNLSLRNPGGIKPHIFMGYKPKGGGNCKANAKWICTNWEEKAVVVD